LGFRAFFITLLLQFFATLQLTGRHTCIMLISSIKAATLPANLSCSLTCLKFFKNF
jgi:hypothetical protein